MFCDLHHRWISGLGVDCIVERGQQVHDGIDVHKVVAEHIEPHSSGHVETHGCKETNTESKSSSLVSSQI